MKIQVNEVDFSEKFYLNPAVGYDTSVDILMDDNGHRLKTELENIMSYRNLVLSKANFFRLNELNSKLVAFYQDPSTTKLSLQYPGGKYTGPSGQGIDSVIFQIFNLHGSVEKIEIVDVQLTSQAI